MKFLCGVENDEFSSLGERKDEVCRHDELQDGVFMARVVGVSVHFVPGDDLVGFPQ